MSMRPTTRRQLQIENDELQCMLDHMKAADEKIRDYLKLSAVPSQHTLLCFVDMIETGEATLDNFEAVGGQQLSEHVQNVMDAYN
jgi:hypothetical protein